MNFIDHSKMKGLHAFLSPSSYHWLNYDEDKMYTSVISSYSAARGTVLHSLAESLISNKIKLTKSDKRLIQLRLAENSIPVQCYDIQNALETLVPYVNDAIGYLMTPEVILYYSDNCFGTADTISYRDNFLRIHDLKTGITPTKMEQLMCYAALFSLEYHINPREFRSELRIYQGNEILTYNPEPNDILEFIERIKEKDRMVNDILGKGASK